MIDINIIFLPLFGFLNGLLVSTLGGGGVDYLYQF